MDYKGTIIEESLKDTELLGEVAIEKTEVEQVTKSFKTPWLKQWTIHTVVIPEEKIAEFSEKIATQLETEHTSWYADFKNDQYHYIVFPHKVFKIDRKNGEEYEAVTRYGLSLGIPEHQLDFSPQVVI